MFWWFSDAKLMERFPENETDGNSGKPVDFDEPHEWLAVLSSSDQKQSHQFTTTTQQTPRMTPKRSARPVTADTVLNSGSLAPPGGHEEIKTAGDEEQMRSFQTDGELATENIVASVVVDREEFVESSEDELNGMIVSLSVELETLDATSLVSHESARQDTVAVVSSRKVPSVCKTTSTTIGTENCVSKHLHGRTNSNKTGMFRR